MGNEEGNFLVTNKKNFLPLLYVLPVLVLKAEEQRVVLYLLKLSGTKLDLQSVVLSSWKAFKDYAPDEESKSFYCTA